MICKPAMPAVSGGPPPDGLPAVIYHPHGFAHLLERFFSYGISALIPLTQDIPHIIHILCKLSTAFAVRGEETVYRFSKVIFQRTCP